MLIVKSRPYGFEFDPKTTAVMMIDFQRENIYPGGFGTVLGHDVSILRCAVEPAQRVLAVARRLGLFIVHTREGHRPDLSDCPRSKRERGRFVLRIGDEGPMGRILIRGQNGHDFVPELKPESGEAVVDKSGKGAFFATDLELLLRNKQIQQLVVCGVTTEVMVHSTIREANDRGFDCLMLEDCMASGASEFHDAAIEMIVAYDGIFGWVATSADFLAALEAA